MDDEDRIKIETWYTVIRLLDHYNDLTFDPMYQRGLKWTASAHDKEVRALKIAVIDEVRSKLFARWEKALGPKWRDALVQHD